MKRMKDEYPVIYERNVGVLSLSLKTNRNKLILNSKFYCSIVPMP